MTTRHLPVRTCKVASPGDRVETHYSVQCHRQQKAAAFEHCCGCEHLRSVEVAPDGKSGSIECDASAQPAPARARVDVAEAAARVRLGDVLPVETTCVRSNLRVNAATKLLVDQGLRAVPVVDEARRLIGIVSKSDLLRKTSSRHRPQTVADIMTPVVRGLPEEAPVAYAIALMAFERLHEVPVVDAEGRVLGMITANDALRWVAGALGYVAPV
ncbi:hypothetical protein BH11MYX4_BH11MYX4_57500 [soil metagenome]